MRVLLWKGVRLSELVAVIRELIVSRLPDADRADRTKRVVRFLQDVTTSLPASTISSVDWGSSALEKVDRNRPMRGGDWPVHRHQRPFIQRMCDDVAVSRSLVFVLLNPKSPKSHLLADPFIYAKRYVKILSVPWQAQRTPIKILPGEMLYRLAGLTIHRTKVVPSGEIDCRWGPTSKNCA